MTLLHVLDHDRSVGGADGTMLRGLAAAFRRVRGVVGRTSSREAGLGTWAGFLPAEPGHSLWDDDELWDDDDDASILIACAWCGRYRMGYTWTTLTAVPEGGRVSHGICPHCFASVGGNAFR